MIMNNRFQQEEINEIRREYHNDALFMFISDSCLPFESEMHKFAMCPEEIFVESKNILYEISGKGKDYLDEVDILWHRLFNDYRRPDLTVSEEEIKMAVSLVWLSVVVGLYSSKYNFYNTELPNEMLQIIVSNNPIWKRLGDRLFTYEEKYHNNLYGWFDKFFEESEKNRKSFKKNHITALAVAMQAKRKYKFASRKLFVKHAIEEDAEFRNCGIQEKNLLNALNDCIRKNNAMNFDKDIIDHGTMMQFIDGCYKTTTRGKRSAECIEMREKAQYFFENL